MSSTRRSSNRQRHSSQSPTQLDQLKGLWKGVKYLFSAKWLSGLAGIDRSLSKRQKSLSKKLIPKAVRDSADALSERVKQAEKSVKNTGKMMSKSVAESAVGKSAGDLARRGKNLEKKAGKFLLKSIAEFFASIIPKPIQDRLKAIGRAFRRVVSTFFVFLGRWTKTRTYWHLIGGIPAFSMALPLAYCLIRMPFYDDAAKAKHYQAALWAAPIDAHDLRMLYRRKLDQLGGANERIQFIDISRKYDAAKDVADEIGMVAIVREMRTLAADPPPPVLAAPVALAEDEAVGPGYPDAHVWFANQYMAGERAVAGALTEQERFERADLHLQNALSRDPANLWANLTQVRMSANDPERQEQYAKAMQVVRQAPSAYGKMARIDYQINDKRFGEAYSTAKELAEEMATKRANGSLAESEYLTAVIAHELIGELALAEEIAIEGLQTYPDQTGLNDRLYKQYYSIAYKVPNTQSSEKLRVAKLAWQIKKTDAWPLVVLADLAKQKDEVGQQARDAANQLLQDQAALPAAFYSVFGTAAAEQKDYDQAAKFLRLAVEASPNDAQTANNLAWVLLQTGNDLQEALLMANMAVNQCPNERYLGFYRETRGQIQLQLGNYRETIDDLTFVLNGLTNSEQRQPVHRSLATAYEQMGQHEQAEAHRQKL